MPGNLEVQVVHSPLRRPAIVGRTSNDVVVGFVCEELIKEAQANAKALRGVDDYSALEEEAEAKRLERLLDFLFSPGGEGP